MAENSDSTRTTPKWGAMQRLELGASAQAKAVVIQATVVGVRSGSPLQAWVEPQVRALEPTPVLIAWTARRSPAVFEACRITLRNGRWFLV